MHFFDMNKTLGFAVFAPDILSPDDAYTGIDVDSSYQSSGGIICLRDK